MTRIQWFVILAALFSIFVVHRSVDGKVPAPAPQSSGKIMGAVFDTHEARIVNARITVEGPSFRREVKPNDLGEYEIDVPSGVYRISAEVPNYYSFKRSAVRVGPNTVRTINIVPVQRILSAGLEIESGTSRERVISAPAPQYESFLVVSSEPFLEALVQFQNKAVYGDLVDFMTAAISYDSLTIYADHIRLNTQTLELQASGKVTVEDGTQRVHGVFARAALRQRNLVVTLQL